MSHVSFQVKDTAVSSLLTLHTTVYVFTYEEYRIGKDSKQNAVLITHYAPCDNESCNLHIHSHGQCRIGEFVTRSLQNRICITLCVMF